MALAQLSSSLLRRLRLATPAPYPAIRTAGDPVLTTKCAPVDVSFHGQVDFEDLVRSMHATMQGDTAMGIAAPQLGVPVQILAFHFKREWNAEGEEFAEVPLTFLVNPSWRPMTKHMEHEFESCLSIPKIAAIVPRYTDIIVDALNLDMKPVSMRLRGWPARVLQHEADHLDGRLYVERMLPRSFRFEEHAAQPLPEGLYERDAHRIKRR